MNRKISISQAISDAWKTTAKNWLILVGLFIVYFTITFFINMVLGTTRNFTFSFSEFQTAAQMNNSSVNIGNRILSSVIQWILSSAFLVVLIPVALDCVKGIQPEFRFQIKKFFILLITCLAIGGITLLIGLAMSILSFGIPFLIIPITLAVFIGFIYLSIRIQFFLYILFEENSSIIDSISKSWRMTKGNILNLVLFFWVQIGILILGCVALLIGLFYAIPLVYTAQAHVYLQLKQEQLKQADYFEDINSTKIE